MKIEEYDNAESGIVPEEQNPSVSVTLLASSYSSSLSFVVLRCRTLTVFGLL